MERLEHLAELAELAGLARDSEANPDDAIAGESQEVDTMYREFAEKAHAHTQTPRPPRASKKSGTMRCATATHSKLPSQP